MQPQREKGFPKKFFKNAKVAQLVEHDLAKVGVAGPNPVFRSVKMKPRWWNRICRKTKSSHPNGRNDNEAQVVELVDTLDLKSNDHCGRAGSSPAPGTS